MDQLLRRNNSHRKRQQEALASAAKKKIHAATAPRNRVYKEAHMLLPIDYVSSARTIGDARLSASKLSKQLEDITMKHNTSSRINADPEQMIRVSRRAHIKTAILNENTALLKHNCSVLAAGGRALVARANAAAAAAAAGGAPSSSRASAAAAAADTMSDAIYNTELLKMEQLEMARGLEKVYSLAAAMRDDTMFIGFTQVRKQKMMEQAWINSMQTYNPVMVDQRMKRMYARKQLVVLNRKFGTPTWTTTAMCLGAALSIAATGGTLLAATPFASYLVVINNANIAFQVVSGCWYITEGAYKAYQTKDWRYLTAGMATGLTKIAHVVAFGYIQTIGGAFVGGLSSLDIGGSYLATGVSYAASAAGHMAPVVINAIFDPATGSIANAYITKLAYVSEDEKQFQQLQERITKRQLLEHEMTRELEETRFAMAQEAYWKQRPLNRNPKIKDMALYLKMLGGKQYVWVHGMMWDKKTRLGKLTHWTYAKISDVSKTQMGIRLIMSLLGRLYPQLGPLISAAPLPPPPPDGAAAAAEQTVVTLSSLLADVFGITGIYTAAASVVYQTIIAPLVISISMALGSAMLNWGVYKFTPAALTRSKTYQRWQAWTQNNRLVDSGKFIMTVYMNSLIRGALLKRFDEMDRTKHFTEKEWTAYTNSVEYLNRTDDAWTRMYHLFVDGIYGGGDLSRNWADPTETRVLDGEEIYALKGTSRLYKNENDFEKVYTASILQEKLPSYGSDPGSPAGEETINILNFTNGKGGFVKVMPGLFQAQSFWVKRQAPGAPPGTKEFVKLDLLEAQANTMKGDTHTQESFVAQANQYLESWLAKHPSSSEEQKEDATETMGYTVDKDGRWIPVGRPDMPPLVPQEETPAAAAPPLLPGGEEESSSPPEQQQEQQGQQPLPPGGEEGLLLPEQQQEQPPESMKPPPRIRHIYKHTGNGNYEKREVIIGEEGPVPPKQQQQQMPGEKSFSPPKQQQQQMPGEKSFSPPEQQQQPPPVLTETKKPLPRTKHIYKHIGNGEYEKRTVEKEEELPELLIEDVDKELEQIFGAEEELLQAPPPPPQQVHAPPPQVVSSIELTEEMEEDPQQQEQQQEQQQSPAIEPQTNSVNAHSKWVADRLKAKDIGSVIKLIEGTKALKMGDHFIKVADIEIERTKASVQYLTQYETQLRIGIDVLDKTYASLKAEDTSGASNVDEYISSVVADLFLSNPLMSRDDTIKAHEFMNSMKNLNNGMVDISDGAFADFIGGFRATMATQLETVAALKTKMAGHLDKSLGETFFDDLSVFLRDSKKMLEDPPDDFGEADIDNMNDALAKYGEKLTAFSKLNNELVHEIESISDSTWTTSHFGGWYDKLTFFSPLKWLQGNFSSRDILDSKEEENTKKLMTSIIDRVRASCGGGGAECMKDLRGAMALASKGEYSKATEIIDDLVARNIQRNQQQQQLESEQLRLADLRRNQAGQIFDATTAARSLYPTLELLRSMVDRELDNLPGGDPALGKLKAEVDGYRDNLVTLVNTVYSKYVLHPDLKTPEKNSKAFTQEDVDADVSKVVDMCGQILERYESGFFGNDDAAAAATGLPGKAEFLRNYGIKNFAFDEDLINGKLDNIDTLLKTNERLMGEADSSSLDKYYQAQDELLQLREDLFRSSSGGGSGGIESMGQRLLKKYQLVDSIARLDNSLTEMLGIGAADFIYRGDDMAGAQQIDIPRTHANMKVDALVARFAVMHETDPKMLELTDVFKTLYDKHRALETLDIHSESADKIFGSAIEYMRNVIRGDSKKTSSSSVPEFEALLQQVATVPETYSTKSTSTIAGQYKTVLNDKASRLAYPAETLRVLSDLEKSITKLDEFASNTPSRAPVDHLSSQLKQSYVRFVRLAATAGADASLPDLTTKLMWTTNHDLAKFYSYVHRGLTETPAARLEHYGTTPHAVHASVTFFDGAYQSAELGKQAKAILDEQLFPFMDQLRRKDASIGGVEARYNMSDSANDVVFFYELMEKTLSPDFAAMYVFEGMNIYGEYASKFTAARGLDMAAPPPSASYDETAKFKEIIIEATTHEQIVDNLQQELENPVLAEQEHSDELLKLRQQAEGLNQQKRRRAAAKQLTAAQENQREKMRQLAGRIPPTEIRQEYIPEEEFKKMPIKDEERQEYKRTVNTRGKVSYIRNPTLDNSDRDTFVRFVDNSDMLVQFYGDRDGQDNLSRMWDLKRMRDAMTAPRFIHDATEFNMALLSMLGITTPEQIRAYVVDDIMKHNPYGYRGMKTDELMEETPKTNEIITRKLSDPKFMGARLKEVLDEMEEDMTVFDQLVDAIGAALSENGSDFSRCVTTLPDQDTYFVDNDVRISMRSESGLYYDDPDIAEMCLVTPLAIQMASPFATAMNTLGGTEVASAQALSLIGPVFNSLFGGAAAAATDTKTVAIPGEAPAAGSNIFTMGGNAAAYLAGKSSILPTILSMTPTGRAATGLAYAANLGEIHLMQNVAPAAEDWIDQHAARWGEPDRTIEHQRETQALAAGLPMAHAALFAQTLAVNANPEKWRLYNGTSREMGSKMHLGRFLVELGMAQYKHGAGNSSVVDIVKNTLTGGIGIASELRDMTVLLKDLELGDEITSIDAGVKIIVRMQRAMSELVSPEMKAALSESDIYDAGNMYEFEQQARAFREYTDEDWLAHENKLLASDSLRDTLSITGFRTALGGTYSALKVSSLLARTTVGAALGTISSVAGDKTLQDATTMALYGTADSSVLKTNYDAIGASMKSKSNYFHPDSRIGWVEHISHTTLNGASLLLGLS